MTDHQAHRSAVHSMRQVGSIVGNRYRLLEIVSSGDWGHIHKGIDLKTGAAVAVKVERSEAKRSVIGRESQIHEALSGGVGVPALLYRDASERCGTIVMDMLGPSLEDLLQAAGGRLSLKSVLMLADQLISRVEYIHAKGFVHRDIKPHNFLVGLDDKSHQVNIIDFGLAMSFWDPKAAQHIPYREKQGFVGTPAFASQRAHLRVQQSRRDDLESIGYMLIYLLQGRLPWYVSNESCKNVEPREQLDVIFHQKLSVPLEVLCQRLPVEFSAYLSYCRGMHFAEKPDYESLRSLFRSRLAAESYQRDFVFDWMSCEHPVAAKPPHAECLHEKHELRVKSAATTACPTLHTKDTLPSLSSVDIGANCSSPRDPVMWACVR